MKPLAKVDFIPHEFQEVLAWLLKVEDFDLVKKLLNRIFTNMPDNKPEYHDYIGMVLHHAKFYPEALESSLKTFNMIPDNINAAYNVARCYNSAGMPDKAEFYIRKVIQAKPDWSSALIDGAVYVCAQGRFDEAYQMLENARLQLPPGDSELEVIRFNMGWHFIRKGEFKKGMEALRIGRKLRIWGAYASKSSKPCLTTETSVQGKKIMIVGEGGAGDEIINVRFAQVLKARGAIPMFASGQKLESIFSRCPDVSLACKSSDLQNVDFDYWAPAMDMPQLLGLDLHEIPNKAYLTPALNFKNKWTQIIPKSNTLKIGLRWQGNPLYERDLYRSVPFAEFESFFNIPNVEFYSLQKDSGLEELNPNSPVKDLSTLLETWEDTLAAIDQLDLVISSCTSIAHLSAALGKKTFIYTPINHYYIWASPYKKSPWYPDVTLFKQNQFHQWGEMTKEIRTELQKLQQLPLSDANSAELK